MSTEPLEQSVRFSRQISKLVAAGRDLWSQATGDWSAEDYLDKLNWLAESGRERQAEKARKKEQGTQKDNLKEVTKRD